MNSYNFFQVLRQQLALCCINRLKDKWAEYLICQGKSTAVKQGLIIRKQTPKLRRQQVSFDQSIERASASKPVGDTSIRQADSTHSVARLFMFYRVIIMISYSKWMQLSVFNLNVEQTRLKKAREREKSAGPLASCLLKASNKKEHLCNVVSRDERRWWW